MNWQIINKFVEIKSSWLTLIGEQVKDENNQLLDYWRIEKSDSLIIIVIQDNSFILPQPVYRHGLGKVTLDFAGGRRNPDEDVDQVIFNILERELNIKPINIMQTQPINEDYWAINSSFSNQKLLGFVTQIYPDTSLKSYCQYSTNPLGVESLLKDLTCVQCRSLLLEYLRNNYPSQNL